MRYLFLLRGAQTSGKSTWIEENNLQPYTLSTDMIRLLYQSPVTTLEGDVAISQDNDTEVWKLLMQLLERRMDKGELVIIDATHYKAPLLNKYKDLVDKYRYRVYVVDFSDVPLEELLKRNAARDKYKRVPESVIQKMVYSLNDSSEVKKSYEILNPNTASQMLSYGAPMQSVKVEKDKVVIFGDIHGCYEPIKTYFENNPFDDNTCYIFVGDYIDRGLQNKEVLEFLLTIYSKSNVILLEGNHERWLREWCSKDYDEKQYEEEPNEYKDYKITKFIKQLKSFMGSKIKERNILQVYLNKDDALMCGSDYIEIGELKDRAKEFIANKNNEAHMPEKTPKNVEFIGATLINDKHVISLQNDRGSSYQAYINVQNELVAAYNELRDELAKEKFAKPYAMLDDAHQKAIREVYPMRISEAEPKKYGEKK